MKKLTTLIIFLLSTACAFTQPKYGNEWIKGNQLYGKIRVSEKGIYKITASQLQALGFFTNGNATKGFQIFYLGQEIPLMIEGGDDNVFDSNDYITFYGNPTNGKLDESLYKTGEQPNAEVSLFDDVASYFLTNSTTVNGKRYQNVSLSDAGLTPETNISYTASKNFSNQYYPGQYVLDVMTFSDYIEGEGYLGSTFGIGGAQVESLDTPNFFSGGSFKPIFEGYVAGRSNAESTNSLKNNHHLNVSVDGVVVKDVAYRGYKTVRLSENLVNTTLNNKSSISFNSINDLGATTDFQAPGYARITYPRTLDASNFQFLEFRLNATTNTNNRVLSFTNTSAWSNSVILNPITSTLYKGVKNASVSTFVINDSNDALVVYNDGALKGITMEAVQFNLINPATSNAKMLMITHKSLMSGVNDIVTYKNSKGISSVAISTEELYNQFGYGIHSAIAIRNYCKYLLENANVKPEFLFLVGKGYELSKIRSAEDLVPTFGFPPSDIGITSQLFDNNLAPALATGRLAAKSVEDVQNYLDKIKSYDSQPNEIWRKNTINITGGANSSEDTQFSNYLKSLAVTALQPSFGGKTTTFYKNVSDPITDNLVGKINNSIENGATMLTYLGHGSTISTAVSIGNANNINNKDKLLFYFINGCSTGNAFVENSLGENYISQKNKGAIGWIGTSSEGVASYLFGIANAFYRNSFNLNYGKSVAQNIATSLRSYQNPNDALNKIHCQQYIYLGDPSLSFYSPQKPDYEIKPQDIAIADPNITANVPNFDLKIVVKNLGKATNTPLKVGISRTLNDNSIISYPKLIFNPVLNTDTLVFKIDNDLGVDVSGKNKFAITLDPDNEYEEISEQNNSTEFEYFFPSNGITLLSPINYSIANNPNLELKLQANNLFSKEASYVFEIDTLNTFDSNWKKTSGIINSGLFASWQPGNILSNNTVYFWRAKLNVPLQDGGQWQNESFTYLQSSSDGFNQSHYQQFSDIELKNIIPKNKTFEYTKTAYPIYVQTRGNTAPTNTERRIRVGVTVGALSFNGVEFAGFTIAAFNPKNSRILYNYPSQYNSSNDGGKSQTGQFFFDTNNNVDLDSLDKYLKNIPAGYYVVGLSGINFSGKNLPNNIKTHLRNLGLNKFENINNGEPYILSSEKGNPSSPLLKEVTADYSSTLSAQDQYITLNEDLPNNWNSGYYESEKIGPSIKWNSVTFNFKTDLSDIVINSVIAIDNEGKETIIKNNVTDNFINIANLDAFKFPFIRLKSIVNDNVSNTVAELKSWKVLFDGYPELSFNPEILNNFYAKEINEGDSLKLSLGISNIKNISTDSVYVKFIITKGDRTKENGLVGKLKSFTDVSNQTFSFVHTSVGFVGDNILQLILEPKNGKDLLGFNNVLSYPFKVVADQKNPIVDLLFDGKRIINGEVVSPKPSINISLSDENKFLLLNDTNAVVVFIKKSEAEYKRVSFSSNKITVQQSASAGNNTVSFLYEPGQLTDGVYTLKIQAKDKSGNSLPNDFLTEFEVVNEQTITNVLPYPNPVVNSTRFIFNVTGSVPDKMKIQISTASGKIVRVISKEELGNIRIGNNMSDFRWDGTDSFGDRLANGVYFYQVFVENGDGSNVKKRHNSTNAYFKNNIGKIYLMR